MIRSLPLLVLLGCPAPHEGDSGAPDGAPPSGTWAGEVGGEAPSGDPRAVWVAVSPGAAIATGPSGTVEEVALMGVDLDVSVLAWVTDLPDPCPALATWQARTNEATLALMDGDMGAWEQALDAASDAVPASFTSVAVGIAAEDAAGLAGGAWPITAEASGETPDGWRAGVVLAERQTGRPDWAGLMDGSADMEDFFAASEIRDGAAGTDGIDGEALPLTLEATLAGGGTLEMDVVATRCPALEDAIAELRGAPSAL